MPDRTCSIEDCDRPHYAKGWCNLHWKRWRKHGDATHVTPKVRHVCVVEDCGHPVIGQMLCSKHYQRWQKHGDPLIGAPRERQFCTIADCKAPVVGRGWCEKHYTRWKRHGDPLAPVKIVGDDVRRFEQYLSPGKPPAHAPDLGPCWLWTSGLSPDGYGKFKVPGEQFAHRWSYTYHVGPIPTGLELDHLCRVRRCVNPWHLEPVTHLVNILRAAEVRYAAHRRRAAATG